MDFDLDEVVEAIRQASTSGNWDETLARYGPTIIKDLNQLTRLQNIVLERAHNDPQLARAVVKWLSDLQDRQSPKGIEGLLMSAGSDEEFKVLLEQNRPLITRDLGMGALREVRAIETGGSALPSHVAGAIVERILSRVSLIATFLQDDLLWAEYYFMRCST